MVMIIIVYLVLKQIKRMNREEVQSSPVTIQAHLDTLIQSIRTREERFLTLLAHLHHLINHRHEIQNNLYIHEEINRYNAFLTLINHKELEDIHHFTTILKRYQRNEIEYEDNHLFLKRVTFRILEIMFHAVNLMTNKIPNIFQEYMKFKLQCQKLLADESKGKPLRIIKLILEYEQLKISKYAKILQKIISCLQEGDYKQFERIQQYFSKMQLKFDFADLNLANDHLAKDKRLSTFELLKKNRLLEKQKINILKEQIFLIKVQQNKANRQLQNSNTAKVKRYVDNFKDVMDINRQDCFQNSSGEKNYESIFKELMNKNRNNQKYIKEYGKFYRHKERKMLLRQEKCESESNNVNLHKNQKNHSIKPAAAALFTNREPMTNRKSLLFKVKENDYNMHMMQPEIIYNSNLQISLHNEMFLQHNSIKQQLANTNIQRSQVFNRLLKTNQPKFRMKSSIKMEQRQKNKMLSQINNIIQENELIALKLKNQNLESDQKLPQLNKRTHSTDKHYNIEENTLNMEVLHLINSLKTSNDFHHKKYKFQKAEFYPNKIKLQLKQNNPPLYMELNKKSIKMSENNKKLYF